MWKDKGQCNLKVTLELYICNFLICENGWNFPSQILCWLVNESELFSSFSLVLWVVNGEVFCWFDFMLFIFICGLFSYALGDMDHFECKHVFWTISFLHAKFRMIVKLTIRCIWSQDYWYLGKFELFHFDLSFNMKSKYFIKTSLNYFMNLMSFLFLLLELVDCSREIE